MKFTESIIVYVWVIHNQSVIFIWMKTSNVRDILAENLNDTKRGLQVRTYRPHNECNPQPRKGNLADNLIEQKRDSHAYRGSLR